MVLHSDGVQAAGKIPVDVEALGVDLYSISGHKIYAPKGIGALYVRKGVNLAPMLYGGHHERDRRAGTENVRARWGWAARRNGFWIMERRSGAREAALRDRLEQGILARVPDAHVNGAGAPRTPNTTNMRFDGIDSERAADRAGPEGLRGIERVGVFERRDGAVARAAAIGLTKEQARSSVRFSLGRSNTERTGGRADRGGRRVCRASEKAGAGVCLRQHHRRRDVGRSG